jgi:Folate receptor family
MLPFSNLILMPVFPAIFGVSLFWQSVWAGSQNCPYYGLDRMSAPENNLANCSWFGANACCKRTEVTSVFSDMFKLFGATKECEDRLSYLMCYFCSPDQGIWFREYVAHPWDQSPIPHGNFSQAFSVNC